MTGTHDYRELLQRLMDAPADARAGLACACGDIDQIIADLTLEAERLLTIEVARAEAAGLALLPLADACGSPGDRARVRRVLAQALAYTGRFDRVLETCAEGITIAEAHAETVEGARLRLASMHALALTGRHDDALRAGADARQALSDAGETALAARADLNLGVICRMGDRPDLAVAHFDRARGPLAHEPMILAQLESNRGEALLELDRLDDAEAAFRAALGVFRDHDQNWGASVAEGNLADLSTRRGRFHDALRHFENARRLMEADTAPTHLARLMIEQADVKAAIGLLDDSERDYRTAIDMLMRHGQRADAARGHVGCASLLLQSSGREDDAMAEIESAITLYESLEHPHALAETRLLQAMCLLRKGWIDEARSVAAEAASSLADRPLARIRALLRVAWIEFEAGDLRASEAPLDEVLRLAERDALTPLLADARHLRGRIREKQARLDAAHAELRASVDACDRIRGALQADRFRASFLGNRFAIYEDLLHVAVSRGNAFDAFDAAERARSRALLDLVRGADDFDALRPADESDEAIVAELEAARAELNNLYARAEHDLGGKRHDWGARAAALEAVIENLESRVAAARGIGGLFAAPSPVAAVQSALPQGCALIEYAAARGHLHAFVVTCGSVALIPTIAPIAAVRQAVRRFHFQIGRAIRPGALTGQRGERLTADARAALAAIASTVFAPIRPMIAEADHLIVVPHGLLHSVPFAALCDERGYLVERYAITAMPSAGVLAHHASQRRAELDWRRAVVVGVADDLAPTISAEARAIADALHATRLTADDATVAAVLEALSDANVAHVACHGRFTPSSQFASGLRLADRWLTVRDIYRLRTSASLITLSGCQTGAHQVESGDELIGLIRAFLAAGASSLCVSLWAAHDEATTDLMKLFYDRALAQRGMLAHAMQAAQCEIMAEHPHPAFWAPFVLVGAT